MSNLSDNFQLWSLSRKSYPDRTIPVRRITEQELLRADSINGFGTKAANNKHQVCNCISPFLLDWIAGWEVCEYAHLISMQVYLKHYRDNRPRLFIYWTVCILIVFDVKKKLYYKYVIETLFKRK